MQSYIRLVLPFALFVATPFAYTQTQLPSSTINLSEAPSNIVTQISSEEGSRFGIESYDVIIKSMQSVTVKAFDKNDQIVGELDFAIGKQHIQIETETETGVWKAGFGITNSAGITEHILIKEWWDQDSRQEDIFSVTTRFVSDSRLKWDERVLDQIYRLNEKMIIVSPTENARKTFSENSQIDKLAKEQQKRFNGIHEERLTRAIISDLSIREHLPQLIAEMMALFDKNEYDFFGNIPESFLNQREATGINKGLIEEAGCVGSCGISAVCAYTGCGGGLACAGCAAAGTTCLVCVGDYMSSVLNSGGGGGSSGGGISPTVQIGGDWTCYRVGSDTIVCESND